MPSSWVEQEPTEPTVSGVGIATLLIMHVVSGVTLE